MPRGRFHSRDLSVNKNFWERLPDDTHRLFWLLLINWLDAEGRIEGDAAIIKGRVCPLTCWTVEQVEAMLQKFETIAKTTGLHWIERYHADGIYCLWATGFHEHQTGLRKDHEAKGKYGYSEIPPPPKSLFKKARKRTIEQLPEQEAEVIKQPKITKIINYYEEQLGFVFTPTQLEELRSIVDNYPDGWFEKAIDEAKRFNAKYPFKYILKILEEWLAKGEPQPAKDKMAGLKKV